MNFIFTDEQIQFKDAIKSFLTDECTPKSIRDGWEAKQSFNLDRWQSLLELGVLNSNLPEDKGGLGMDQVTAQHMIFFFQKDHMNRLLLVYQFQELLTAVGCYN